MAFKQKSLNEEAVKRQIEESVKKGDLTGVFNTLSKVPTSEWKKYLSGNEKLLEMSRKTLDNAKW